MKPLTRFSAMLAVLMLAIALPRAFGQYESGQGAYGQYPAGTNQYQARLSPDDQQKFDHYYQKWVDDTRRNDRDDISKDEQHMRDIMARYNIPTDVPFETVATIGYSPSSQQAGYGNGPFQPRPVSRLSPDDQREFDQAYSKWENDTRRNDRDDIMKDEQKMRDIMARNGIPQSVSFEAIASGGASGTNAYDQTYPASTQWRTRLSPDDQQKFDKAYSKWVNDSRKNDRDDIAKDEQKMRDIMSRNNIPPDVPFSAVASSPANYNRY